MLTKVKQLLQAIDDENQDAIDVLICDLDRLCEEVNSAEIQFKQLQQNLQEYSKEEADTNKETIEEMIKLKMDLEDLNEKYQDLSKSFNQLESDNISLKTQLTISENSKVDITPLENKISELTESLNNTLSELDEERNKPDYSEEVVRLREENDNLKKRLESTISESSSVSTEQFEKQLNEIKQNNEQLSNLLKSKTDIIKSLTEELELTKTKPKFTIEEKLDLEDKLKSLQVQLASTQKTVTTVPIITDWTEYTGSKIIVFRELKPCIYMNSLIKFLAESFTMYNRTDGKISGKKLLLVLDPLTDENRVIKYVKHKFVINTPVAKNPGTEPEEYTMLVTNKSESEISELVDFSDYEYLVIIDRYNKEKCAVKRLDTDIYYSVDSISDTEDFNLNRNKCVAYMPDPNNTTHNNSLYKFEIKEQKRFGYYVEPILQWPDSLSYDEHYVMFASCNFVKKVLCNED